MNAYFLENEYCINNLLKKKTTFRYMSYCLTHSWGNEGDRFILSPKFLSERNEANWNLSSAHRFFILSCYPLHQMHIPCHMNKVFLC